MAYINNDPFFKKKEKKYEPIEPKSGVTERVAALSAGISIFIVVYGVARMIAGLVIDLFK